MCLAVPGKVLSVEPDPLGVPTGMVSFGGITKPVCLAYVPGVRAGDYVMVHVGFALSTIDEAEAREVFRALGRLDGPDAPASPDAADAPAPPDASAPDDGPRAG